MASNSTISIGFKIEDAGNGLKTLTLDADALRKVMNANVTEASRLDSAFINFAAVATSVDSLSGTLRSLRGVVGEYTSAYAVQLEVETQLAQVMRNTMEAREEDIQGIKDFCSAQQQIGIIGDEVQLAGAQELATYLSLKSSLKSLIPVMNDMLAQQYGFSASGENAAQIASMLGKVMEGQTGALSRYGYKFDEAQEKVLKYGTETERVAVLVDVVSESVGGMNRSLAETDMGNMKQMENYFGDIKEQIGEAVQGLERYVEVGANTMECASGFIKLYKGAQTARRWINTLTVSTTALNAVMKITGMSAQAAAAAIRCFYVATGVGAALVALTWVLDKLNDNMVGAAKAADRFATAQERARRASEMGAELAEAEADARQGAVAALELNISRLKEFNGTKTEERKLVKEMNDTYGDTMGYFSSVADWYDALIKNSQAYCRQLVAEAKARKLADQIAELEMKRDKIARNEDGSQRKYSTSKPLIMTPDHRSGMKATGYGESEAEKAQRAYDDYTDQIKSKRAQMEAAAGEKQAAFPVRGSSTPPTDGGTKTTGTKGTAEETRLQRVNRELTEYQERFISGSHEEREAIRGKVSELLEEKRAIERARAEMERPLKLDTLEDYDREISALRKTRQTAGAEELREIDALISRRERERDEFEGKGGDGEPGLAALADVAPEKIESYRELEAAISACTELLREGTAEERRFAADRMPGLRRREREMSASVAEAGVATRPEEADTLAEIDEAVSLLDMRMQSASASEIEGLQRTRMEFERKREAYERGIRVPEMQREAAELLELPERELTVRVREMGFDALTEKIREVERELGDLENPPTAGQRAALEELKALYEDWRRTAVMTFGTLREGWEGVKGSVSGIETMAGALSEGTTAWEKMTAVVDGFIQVYNGVASLIAIMEQIGVVSRGNAAAKTQEAAAAGVSMAATQAEAASSAETAAAAVPVIAANKLAAQSFTELAAAQYFAAHASIPFAGFGIASGFAGAATAIVQGIGAMPFADGGVVYGPTLGLVGEYAGARHNPEVIAPLDRLRELIGGPASAPVIIGGTIKADGRELAVVLENYSRITGKSGRRTRF